MDSSNGELQAGSGRPGLGSFLGLSGAELAAFASFSAFARLKEIVKIELEIELHDQGTLCKVSL